MYNPRDAGEPRIPPHEEIQMGTCPKCKRRIRKNGNHIKLGSVWFHKMCPDRKAAAAKRA